MSMTTPEANASEDQKQSSKPTPEPAPKRAELVDTTREKLARGEVGVGIVGGIVMPRRRPPADPDERP
jgi:hypothetical protein